MLWQPKRPCLHGTQFCARCTDEEQPDSRSMHSATTSVPGKLTDMKDREELLMQSPCALPVSPYVMD